MLLLLFFYVCFYLSSASQSNVSVKKKVILPLLFLLLGSVFSSPSVHLLVLLCLVCCVLLFILSNFHISFSPCYGNTYFFALVLILPVPYLLVYLIPYLCNYFFHTISYFFPSSCRPLCPNLNPCPFLFYTLYILFSSCPFPIFLPHPLFPISCIPLCTDFLTCPISYYLPYLIYFHFLHLFSPPLSPCLISEILFPYFISLCPHRPPYFNSFLMPLQPNVSPFMNLSLSVSSYLLPYVLQLFFFSHLIHSHNS